MSPVFEYLKGLGQDLLVVHRNLQLVDRLIEVVEAFRSAPNRMPMLSINPQSLLFEVLGSVETHVLEEVGDSAHRPLPSTPRL